MNIQQFSAIGSDWLPLLAAALQEGADVVITDCDLSSLRPAFTLLNAQRYDVRYDAREQTLKAHLQPSLRGARVKPPVREPEKTVRSEARPQRFGMTRLAALQMSFSS